MGGSKICGGLKRLLRVIGNTSFSLAALGASLQVEAQKGKGLWGQSKGPRTTGWRRKE